MMAQKEEMKKLIENEYLSDHSGSSDEHICLIDFEQPRTEDEIADGRDRRTSKREEAAFRLDSEKEYSYLVDSQKERIGPVGPLRRPGEEETETEDEEGDKRLVKKKIGKGSRCCKIKHDALAFGTRMCIICTISSLFVLIRLPENERGYPSGAWVYVTACIVSWFPALDVASVIQKDIQRVIGTAMGASLGLGLGFFSLILPEGLAQNIYLGACLSLVTFAYCTIVIQFDFIKNYSYCGMLGLFTFGIALLPFYTDEDPKFKNGCFRILNVFIGCFISALGSLMVWPRSSRSIIQSKVMKQIENAGESSRAVMHAAHDSFTGKRESRTLPSVLDKNDSAHQAYSKAITDWKVTKAKLPLLKYDPFFAQDGNEGHKESFQREVSLTLARAFRIQSTLISLDSIVRNEKAMNFGHEEIKTFFLIGSLIKHTLTICDEKQLSNVAAEELSNQLSILQRFIAHYSQAVQVTDDYKDASLPTNVRRELMKPDIKMPATLNEESSILLYLLLVQNLVIRTLRLYYCWREYGERHIIYDKLHMNLY